MQNFLLPFWIISIRLSVFTTKCVINNGNQNGNGRKKWRKRTKQLNNFAFQWSIPTQLFLIGNTKLQLFNLTSQTSQILVLFSISHLVISCWPPFSPLWRHSRVKFVHFLLAFCSVWPRLTLLWSKTVKKLNSEGNKKFKRKQKIERSRFQFNQHKRQHKLIKKGLFPPNFWLLLGLFSLV